jgi:serine/threonine protein kinase
MKLHKIAKRELKIFRMDEIIIVPTSAQSKPSGTYGEIIPAILKDGNVQVILKKYKNDISNIILDADMIREIIILQHLNQYPETSTVQLLGIYFDYPRHHCFLVLESLETDLHKISIKYKHDQTKNKGRFNYQEYKIIFYKCLKALNAIHSLGFIHNDIKLPNIMLNGTDIKFIDFGLSKYIGLSPLIQQITTYLTTDVIQAPEKRISYSTDIFSLASSMIHLSIRDYGKIFINHKSEILDKDNMSNPLNSYLGMDRVFGPDGLDLLLKLMVSNPENRWCANKALQHKYFDDIRHENREIDRSVVGLMGGNPIHGLIHHVDYKLENFQHKNMELCYYEELHMNYKDDICPIQSIENDINQYHTLMDWILHKFNDSLEYNQLFYGIDVLINGIITTKTNFIKNQQKIPIALVNTRIDATFNMLLFRDIFTEEGLDYEYMLENPKITTRLISYFYENLNINIKLLPISVHISYIYLQLRFEIKKIKTITFEREFFQDICLHVIFWFIQPIPYEEPITTWELVVFTTIKLLSKIIMVPAVELIRNPIIPVITMDEKKYQQMLDYFCLQYLSIDFEKYRNYTIYFNNTLFIPNEFST